MGYIIAFLIFILIISFIGFLFSFLWPLIIIFVILAAIGNFRSYKKRKNTYQQFYGSESTQEREEDSILQNDDIIDVEFSEQEVDDK